MMKVLLPRVVGFKDMHREQIDALTRVVGHALALSDAMSDREVFNRVLNDVETLVMLFGGQGVEIIEEFDDDESEDQGD